jgi:Carboxypeptidase regulatory-like domain
MVSARRGFAGQSGIVRLDSYLGMLETATAFVAYGGHAMSRPTTVFALVLGALAVRLALASPSRLEAQAPVPAAATSSSPAHDTLVTVVGVAVDSMHGSWLSGAQVALDGSLRMATTDSTGRFRLDSVPARPIRIAIYHPTLDSIGIGMATAPLALQPGTTLSVVLGTPSPLTVQGLLCSGTPVAADSGGGPSLIVGRILDAESDEPVAGAHVSLRWTDLKVNAQVGLKHIERTRDTVSNTAGGFHFCWVPANNVLQLHATRSDQGQGVDRRLLMSNRRVALVALHVPGAVSASSAPTAGAELDGRVQSADGKPMIGARVQLFGGTDSAVTTDSGGFTLRGLPTGSQTLVVRAVGYDPLAVPVELSVRSSSRVVVPFGEKAAVLQAVLVEARLKTGYHAVGFDRRQAAGMGTFLTAADIERRNAGDFHDLLIGLPGIMTASSRSGKVYLTGSRANRCIHYTVDGNPFRQTSRDDIDTFVQPNEVGAIEVYESSEVPNELVVGRATTCTNVIIWTKTRLGL